jgi:hypothetical protein
VGPTPTLPPNHQPALTSRTRRTRPAGRDADRDLVLGDQAPATTLQPAAASDRDGDLALAETAQRAHRELAETNRTTYPPQESEPLGRRLPLALDTTRQGVER